MAMILVVDDKEMLRDSVGVTLERAGFEVETAADGAAALEVVARRRPDAVITDMRMPGLTGIELLERLMAIDADLPVVMMTAFGTIDTAVKAMRLGAFDYLTKPFEGDELIISVKRAVEHRRVIHEIAVLRASAEPPFGDRVSRDELGSTPAGGQPTVRGVARGPSRGTDRMIGAGPLAIRMRADITSVASSHGTVLITGESGVGKEVAARAVHELSPRRDGPFLAVNCAALSEGLLESELFGHEKGAFTGADRMRKGRFELAHGGTLLLDEVSEISPKIQAKLLRVIQERTLERVGSGASIGVDVRIIATSNRDLQAEVDTNQFRQDLFFRLNVLPLPLPSLRERREDVAALAQHFLNENCRRDGRPGLAFSPEANDALAAYSWPGNVRELQNICERAVVLWPCKAGDTIGRELVEPWLRTRSATPIASASQQIEGKPLITVGGITVTHAAPPVAIPATSNPPTDDARTLEEIERETIVRTLGKFNGHRQRTASMLGIGVRTLGLKLKKWKQMKLVGEEL